MIANTQIEIIQRLADQYKSNAERNNRNTECIALIDQLTQALLGELPFSTAMVAPDKLIYNYEYQIFVGDVCQRHVKVWGENNELIDALISDGLNNKSNYHLWNFIFQKINAPNGNTFMAYLLSLIHI